MGPFLRSYFCSNGAIDLKNKSIAEECSAADQNPHRKTAKICKRLSKIKSICRRWDKFSHWNEVAETW